jgi:hypothetical protein
MRDDQFGFWGYRVWHLNQYQKNTCPVVSGSRCHHTRPLRGASVELGCTNTVSSADTDQAGELVIQLLVYFKRTWFTASAVSNTDGNVAFPDELETSSAYSARSSTCSDTSLLNLPLCMGARGFLVFHVPFL